MDSLVVAQSGDAAAASTSADGDTPLLSERYGIPVASFCLQPEGDTPTRRNSAGSDAPSGDVRRFAPGLGSAAGRLVMEVSGILRGRQIKSLSF